MQYIRINNWKKFQQYKDRRPNWIKLLIEIIDEFDADGNPKKYYKMPDQAKTTFLHLLCLRANYNEKIPYPNDRWLKKRLGLRRVSLQPLADAGFIIIDTDSVSKPYETVQNCTEVVRQRERESKSKRERKETEKEQHLDFVFLTKDEHKKLIRRFGEKNTKKLIDDLDYYISNIKKGKDPYTEHYRTLCKWAIKGNLKELEPSPETKEQEAAGREKARKAKRKEYGPWIKAADEPTLIDFYKNNVHLRWMIKELRPEIATKAK